MMRPLDKVIRRPARIVILLLALLLLAGVGGGLYLHALHQWSAAQAAVKENRLEEASRRLKLCLFVWPRSAQVHLLAARAARLNGDFEGAEAHLNRCLKLQKGATEATQLEFLLLRVQTGEVDQVAPALLDLVEKKHPQTPLILETLSRSYMHHLRYRQAYDCLSRWIEATPEAARPYEWRGWVLERMDSHQKAMEDYLRALERDPGLFPLRLRVAEMLLEDNKVLEALPRLKALQREEPDNPQVLARLGQALLLQGRLKEARRLLQAAVERLPRDLPLLLHLGKLELDEGRPGKAEYWVKRVLETDRTDTEAYYTLIAALRLQGRFQEASAAEDQFNKYASLLGRANRLLREEAKQPTRTPDRPHEIGTLLLRLEKERLGLYWLHEALKRDGGHQPTHRTLADFYEKKGERDRAAAHRRRVLDRTPRLPGGQEKLTPRSAAGVPRR